MENLQAETLRSLSERRGLYIGAAVNARALREEAAYRETLAREYNMLTPENEMKFGSLVKDPSVYNFGPADEIVSFARANDMSIRGHTLVWHNQNPEWLRPENFTRNQAIDLLEKHIFTVIGHFHAKIYAWDVINEGIAQDGSLRETFWLKTIGPEYFDYAFRFAREADKNPRLFYNEYAADDRSPKADGMYQLLKDLKEHGTPVDGVGLQMHFALYDSPNFACPPAAEDLTANLNRLADLGLEIHITELDVQVQNLPGEREELLARQAQVYRDLLDTVLQNRRLKAVVTWGFTDRHSWIPRFTGQSDWPLPFDEYYQPKPAYNAIYQALENE
jgi:endo-1,4-beta-xylanase